MTVAEAVAAKRVQLFEAMAATVERGPGVSEASIRQFVWGFVNVLEAGARGDDGPRDIYLSSVIPALRNGSMAYELVVSSMLRVAAAAACVLGREYLPWVSGYCSDYLLRLLKVWESGQ